MRVFIVTYLCSVVGVYSCAVDAQQCTGQKRKNNLDPETTMINGHLRFTSDQRGVLLVSKTATPMTITLRGNELANITAHVLDMDPEPGFLPLVERLVGRQVVAARSLWR